MKNDKKKRERETPEASLPFVVSPITTNQSSTEDKQMGGGGGEGHEHGHDWPKPPYPRRVWTPTGGWWYG
jgi:hypothetical protein